MQSKLPFDKPKATISQASPEMLKAVLAKVEAKKGYWPVKVKGKKRGRK